jgi:hypothetical protein
MVVVIPMATQATNGGAQGFMKAYYRKLGLVGIVVVGR